MNDTALFTNTTPSTHIEIADSHKAHERLKDIVHADHPRYVLDMAEKELNAVEKELGSVVERAINSTSYTYKAQTLHEFENGILMASAVPEHMRTFALDLMIKYQKEYNCETVSEKSLCEIAALSFVRLIETQRKLTELLEYKTKEKDEIQLMSILSKELDRANRHFNSAIQDLKNAKQPAISYTIKTKNANFGNQQIVHPTSINDHE